MTISNYMFFIALLFASLVIEAEKATANLVTYQFSGEVTSVSDPGASLTGLVSTGTSYSGTFTFDTFDTFDADALPGDTTVGFYNNQPVPPNGFSISLGSLHFESSPVFSSGVTVYDNNFGLRDRLQLQTQPASSDFTLSAGSGFIALNLWDFSQTAFSSDSLSEAINVDPNDFQEISFGIQAFDTNTGMVFNIFSTSGVTSFVSVPEASTVLVWSLLTVGAGVGAMRRRRKEKSTARGVA